MVMKSKFSSRCTACGGRIAAGEEIELVRGVKGAKHATVAQCAAAKASAAQSTPKIDLAKIVEFLRAARVRGLKHPKLRVLDVDGRTELRLGLTTQGTSPGSVSVVRADTFVGCVRPDGSTTSDLSRDTQLQQHILRVAEDPVTAAKEYAAVMGRRCSFCSKSLTDEGSTDVGYGPICARKYGLPHTPKGTPELSQVPVA